MFLPFSTGPEVGPITWGRPWSGLCQTHEIVIYKGEVVTEDKIYATWEYPEAYNLPDEIYILSNSTPQQPTGDPGYFNIKHLYIQTCPVYYVFGFYKARVHICLTDFTNNNAMSNNSCTMAGDRVTAKIASKYI